MKTRNLIFLALALLLVLVWAVRHKPAPTHTLLYLPDLTEHTNTHVALQALCSVSAPQHNPLAGETIRIVPIADLSFMPAQEFHLEPIDWPILHNELERNHDRDRYYADIDSALTLLDTATKSRPASYIFSVIAREVNVAADHNTPTTLVINSDLMENSPLASFYNPTTFAQLQANPQSFADTFTVQYPLTDLSGMHVYLIFEPHTQAESIAFEATTKLYTLIFESHGATVTVGANLITHTTQQQ